LGIGTEEGCIRIPVGSDSRDADGLFPSAFLRDVMAEGIDLAEAGATPWNFLRSPEDPQTRQKNAPRTIVALANVPHMVNHVVAEQAVRQVERMGIERSQDLERAVANVDGDHTVTGCEGFHGVEGC
jgi:hypothetical protein